jgi:hypothetical protein
MPSAFVLMVISNETVRGKYMKFCMEIDKRPSTEIIGHVRCVICMLIISNMAKLWSV